MPPQAFTQDFGQVVQHQMVEEDIGSVQNREVSSGSTHGQGHVTPKSSKVPFLPGIENK